MKRRILSFIAIAVLLAALVTGCRKKEPEPTPTPAPTADPHEGEIEVTNGAGGTIWVKEAERLTPFSLDRYAFSVSDQIPNYSRDDGTRLMRGIDVSEFQHEIDWEAVAASGVEFAIVRIGWRGWGQGTLNEDVMYRQNIEGARAAGLLVGAYFFSQAVNLMEAAEEAVYTAKLLEGLTLDLPVFFDWETIGTEPARTDGLSPQVLTECCLEYCKLLESAGYSTGVYTYIPVVYKEYILNDMEGLTFWLGDPGNWPEFYYEHAYWQYSFTGTVPGIDADVDLDVMYLPAGTAAPVHVPSPTPEPEAASGPADVTEPAEVPAEPASETEAGG